MKLTVVNVRLPLQPLELLTSFYSWLCGSILGQAQINNCGKLENKTKQDLHYYNIFIILYKHSQRLFLRMDFTEINL